jgi:hypothetical protein
MAAAARLSGRRREGQAAQVWAVPLAKTREPEPAGTSRGGAKILPRADDGQAAPAVSGKAVAEAEPGGKRVPVVRLGLARATTRAVPVVTAPPDVPVRPQVRGTPAALVAAAIAPVGPARPLARATPVGVGVGMTAPDDRVRPQVPVTPALAAEAIVREGRVRPLGRGMREVAPAGLVGTAPAGRARGTAIPPAGAGLAPRARAMQAQRARGETAATAIGRAVAQTDRGPDTPAPAAVARIAMNVVSAPASARTEAVVQTEPAVPSGAVVRIGLIG